MGNIALCWRSEDLYLPRSADSLILLNKRFEYQKELPVSADFGANDWLVEEMYERYQADPTSVEPSWIEFFKTYQPGAATSTPVASAPATSTPATSAPKGGTPPIPKAAQKVSAPAPVAQATPAPVVAAPVVAVPVVAVPVVAVPVAQVTPAPVVAAPVAQATP